MHSFKAVQQIPISPAKAWDFFSRPENLPSITPPDMEFRITSKYHGEKMYPGQVIEYQLKALPFGPPFYWMTEITHVEEEIRFVDEQRFGPYAFWHHQHHFRPLLAGNRVQGVEMTDIVHYKIPLGFAGDLVNKLFVGRRLRRIFDYRYSRIEALFGIWPTYRDWRLFPF